MTSRRAFFFLAPVPIASAILLLVACTKDELQPNNFSVDGSVEPTPTKKDSAPFDPGDVFLPVTDSGGKTGQVFAHTAKALYKFEPYSRTLSKIGDFDCLTGGSDMLDIALNESGQMFGTEGALPLRKGHFVTIDPISAKCTARGTEDYYPNSLGFVPARTIDPVKETLVGYDGEFYLKIDLDTGKMTDIGTLNPPGADAGTLYYSSGDIVAIIGDKAYLTANDTSDLGDFLLEINPATGRRVKVIAPLVTRELWGAGYWGGKIYAFSSKGEVLEVNPATGAKSTVAQLPVADGGTGFYGAGVTTSAPTKP